MLIAPTSLRADSGTRITHRLASSIPVLSSSFEAVVFVFNSRLFCPLWRHLHKNYQLILLFILNWILHADPRKIRNHKQSRFLKPQIIANRGYPSEVHTVITDDGYILELHRIPRGRNEAADPTLKKRAVLLQHGLVGTSCDWVFNPPSNSLRKCISSLNERGRQTRAKVNLKSWTGFS